MRLLAFTWLQLLLLPSLVYVVTAQSSLAVGVMASCLVVVVLHTGQGGRLVLHERGTIGYALVIVCLAISLLTVRELDLKKVLSLGSLGLLLAAMLVLESRIARASAQELRGVISVSGWVLLALGYLSLLGSLGVMGYEHFSKAVFPFSEPSHYALGVGPTILAFGFFLRPHARLVLIFLTAMLSTLLPSMVLFAFVPLMILVYFRPLRALAVAVFLSLGVVVALTYSDTLYEYVGTRVDFFGGSANVTALVYMQGWVEAYGAFVETRGIGLGFQSMGETEPSDLAIQIHQLAQAYKNRGDGGFLASKLIAELGVIGVIVVLSYLRIFVRAVRFLRRNSRADTHEFGGCGALFGALLVVGFVPELMLRGYGYFSPGVCTLVVGLLLFARGMRATGAVCGRRFQSGSNEARSAVSLMK